jgi:hypothetical protein
VVPSRSAARGLTTPPAASADPSTPLFAAFATWRTIYADLADGFGVGRKDEEDWGALEKEMLAVVGIDKLPAVEGATVESGQPGAAPA